MFFGNALWHTYFVIFLISKKIEKERIVSIEEAKAAVEKVKTDSKFRNQLMAITDVGKRIELINKSGFSCTTEEINKLSKMEETVLLNCPDKMVINLEF